MPEGLEIVVADLNTAPHQHRHHGIGRALLASVEARARGLGCCKLTLEVLEGNAVARRAYEAGGFRQAVYGDATGGGSLFYAKPL